ncbi:MAG: ATP-binding protein [Dictyoglomus turgidum]
MDIKLNFKETKNVTKQVILNKRVPFVWGPPGIGKSSLGREIAEELGAEIYILDAPLLQPIDYMAPVPNHAEKKVHLYTSGFLPESGPAVVLVEDLPHAKTYQQIPLMQMVLDRRIGPMKFSDDVYFIITGNREEDLAGVNPLPSPLLNRLVHIDMDPDLEEWMVWAKINGINEDIAGFLRAFPGEFLKLPEEGKKAWPTPRSWHIFSDCIKDAKSEEMIRYIGSGTVGSSTTQLFIAYVKYLKEIDPKAIVEKGELPQEESRDKIFAYIQAVTGLLKKNGKQYMVKHKDGVVNFFRWLRGEFKMAFLKELVTYDQKGKPIATLVATLAELEPEVVNYITQIIS